VTVTLDEGSALGHVVYQIDEGPRPKIAAVRFEGNKSLKSGELLGSIKTKKKKLWSLPFYSAPPA
jgi:outer membrane protein assembly factor BamA